MRLIPLIALAVLALSACADDADPKTTPDPLAGCTRDALEQDFTLFGPPQGPAVDPQSGAINPPAGAIVATTYLALKPEEAANARFMQLIGPIQQQLAMSPGLLAISTSDSRQCGVARTLTVWESEAAMLNFVMSKPHADAMQATAEVSRGGSVTMTWSHASGELKWADAAARLKDHDGPVY